MLVAPAGDGRGARPLLEAHGNYVLAVLAHPGRIRARIASSTSSSTSSRPPTRRDDRPQDGSTGRPRADRTASRRASTRTDRRGRSSTAPSTTPPTPSSSSLDGLYEEIDDLEDDRRAAVRQRTSAGGSRSCATSSCSRGERRARRAASLGACVDGRLDIGRSELFPPEVESRVRRHVRDARPRDGGARRRPRPPRRRARLLPGEDRRAAERGGQEAHRDRLARARAEPDHRVLRPELRRGVPRGVLERRGLGRPDRRDRRSCSSRSSAGGAGSERSTAFGCVGRSCGYPRPG